VADDGPAFQGVETVSGEAAERGLQKLHRVIGLSGGYTDVQSGPETGTCVTVHLPTG
jgi:hypothetical protein